ncbi:MAG: hypothetical protein KAJ49_05910 [Arcobacteraceae bacterium]|nr:hypothetical protein [Arcobacteraceae bacterium]
MANKVKDTAKELIAVSLGYIASSLLLAMGIDLCIKKYWVGIFPIIIGYELARYVIIFTIKSKILGFSK